MEDEKSLSGTPHLNILLGYLELAYIRYMCDCQSLACAPTQQINIPTVDNIVRLLGGSSTKQAQ